MNTLDVKDVVKYFGETIALNHASFTLTNDDFLVLAGPSNSGKTTLLRLLSGLEQPESGQIILNGVNITPDSPATRKVALVTQKYGLAAQMSVYDNIAQTLRFRRLSKKNIYQQVQSALELLELQHIQKTPLRHLSGGEIQRVAIGKAMVKDADLYLFDEPIIQLDPHTRHRVHQAIQMVHRLKLAISIYATQNPTAALTIATRLAIIHQGQIQQIGTPHELLHRPANLFIAHYLNQPLNQLTASLQATETGYVVQADGLSFTLSTAWHMTLAPLHKHAIVTLGIRPNAIHFAWAFSSIDVSTYIQLQAHVLRIELLMGKWTLQLSIGQQTTLVAELKDINHPSLLPGKSLNLAINPDDIYLFHPITETLLQP
ncbi:ABC transporter ATP-binding protein [Dictyobacter kobayashii]|uniref:ABC transporter ATP-binding protein n=1 Tax=Dictyobacter kobayashii TaxID=2014872 RepID=A0A402AEM4_9CHLR|nr:ABC transporter ATP-binding protein [Dictyobacter kobayashii]GCE17534.1 ABC transporter ATP-binding protein [Dictyobacter kobayashii]